MTKRNSSSSSAVSALEVWGYKSIERRQRIDLAPLTLLAGANSSGKSSLMQPVLLMKQTLEVSYDPGALLLDGPHVRFSSVDQMFSRVPTSNAARDFGVKIEDEDENYLEISFGLGSSTPIETKWLRMKGGDADFIVRDGMSEEDILKTVPFAKHLVGAKVFEKSNGDHLVIERDRFKFNLVLSNGRVDGAKLRFATNLGTSVEDSFIRSLIHLPGLRGNPARSYPVTAIGTTFPGTFEAYTASMVSKWQNEGEHATLAALGADMANLGLTWKVQAKPINDTQVELLVGRLPKKVKGGDKDVVSIADVGLGLSQTLPVLVALHAAAKGQTIYLEQPEIHLHPRAQLALAEVLASAVRRGVRLIVETHSSTLLLGVQTLVAEDKLDASDVQLHWFNRNPKTGFTDISSSQLDETGAFGDWPVDFGDVTLSAENAYLSAAEKKIFSHLQ